MTSKTKILELSGARYQLRKFFPDVGSFILMQMIGAGIKSGNIAGGGDSAESDTVRAAATDLHGEDMVRAVAFAAFLRGLDYEMHRFMQLKCLSTCSRLEDKEGTEIPMPIVNDSGVWAISEIRDDMALVMRLEVEALVFNFSDFFEQGGLNALVGNQASTA